MTKEELIDRINDIEWEDFEAKEAKSELPKNIWGNRKCIRQHFRRMDSAWSEAEWQEV